MSDLAGGAEALEDNEEEREPLASGPDLGRHYKKRRLLEGENNILTSTTNKGAYQPKTRETWATCKALFGVIQQLFGGQLVDIVARVADEFIAGLKNGSPMNPDKKREEIEKLLNPISNQVFDLLVSIGGLITDYQLDAGEASEVVDNHVGVAVKFAENEEEGGKSGHDLVEDEDKYGRDLNGASAMQMRGRISGMHHDDVEIQDDNGGMTLNVQDIDAHWLQRKILQAYGLELIGPQQSQTLVEEFLKILAEGDDREVETKLLLRLPFHKFSLVKYMLRNRLKIVWCTRLARAEDQEDRKRIEEEMMVQGADHAAILQELHATRTTAKDREKNLGKSVIEEARLGEDESGGDGPQERQDLADRDADGGWVMGKRQIVDLDNLAFHQGGLLMANKKCKLPLGSVTHVKKGYDEIYVPALKPKPLAPGEELVKICSMPDWAQPAFKGMTQLNRIQSKVYETALFSADNILLCAPTGAGKTNVAILTILQQIALNKNYDGSSDHKNCKIVYVAPMQEMLAEVVGYLSNRLHDYDVEVKEVSGDEILTSQQIKETQIIVATPEKWDMITRMSGDGTYPQWVKLVIIDEIHLLHDDRGPFLEGIVARIVRQIETTEEHIRLVGLSATLQNYEDVALFLRVDLKKGLFYFDNRYRPVPLVQQYVGISVKSPLQRFELMDAVCNEKVISVAGKHQVLIFVQCRIETAETARALLYDALANDTHGKFLKEDSVCREILQSHTKLVKNNNLKELLPYGFAIHHAEMDTADRRIIEDLFSNGHVRVLVSTATLAWGVNLRAHTVIIKGTRKYNPEKDASTELSHVDVMRMLGRAGRPQHESYGEGIIITGHSELPYCLSVMNEQLPIESQFVSKLADQLNVEIVLGSVQNVKEACTWLCYTYMFIRMLRNPTLYGLAADVLAVDNLLENRRADLVHSAATLLEKKNFIKYDRKSGHFQVTNWGRIRTITA